MTSNGGFDRRSLIARGATLFSALALGGCRGPGENVQALHVLDTAETVDYRLQRLLLPNSVLAPEYREADISPVFRLKGSTNPDDPQYQRFARDAFKDWRLTVDGLVDHPAKYSLQDLRSLPARTQITRHDCVDGWSCIGKWKGVQLAIIVGRAGLKPEARYIVFHCADTLGYSLDASKYYESIGLDDAMQAQTILAYDMNEAPLAVGHGAPLRLRVERQLGYKMAKFVMRIEAVASFAQFQGGKGGYWEDRGYEWYAGI